MLTVGRFLFVIPIGFILACYAGAFALLWPFLDSSNITTDDPVMLFQLFLLFTAQAAQIGSNVVIGWGLFMIVSELMRYSSLLLHAGLGLVSGFVFSQSIEQEGAGQMSVRFAVVMAGLAFGLVYWLIAGRNAGNWRRKPVLTEET
ncbi:hypothetical protein FPY71_14400 [Aureimonas fodinaquatilis]|uniref:Uncharacterized protein n=1 Tax=Aureimonas fodinaquatilis TaxID=2565783 RepID=A0A5B0DUT2_9HYPH|nr:hypothetical protein [Aureimonas fodinaquatilis]KAA0969705.1 hypothetical protein FPY71_14400 [Aureimonas fodinaquatilis]